MNLYPMLTKTEKLLKFVGILCLMYALLLLVQRYSPYRLQFDQFSPSKETKQVLTAKQLIKYPKRLIIKRINLDLPIFPAKIENNRWETTEKGVSHLISSPLPGEKGNSIVYGHNWSNLLGPLPEVKVNDLIEIEFADKKTKQFIVQYIVEVTPDQTHVLSPTVDHRLTLYTCSGFLDSKRLVIVATAK